MSALRAKGDACGRGKGPKVSGYTNPRSNPASRLNVRRREARALLDECIARHPRDEHGRCALTRDDRLAVSR